ncbi:eukaryotic translation initiation factor 3 [Lentinula edodes]|nr:eukaryotic translation initiation factor 3 [Lentinula edodes]
MPLGPPSSAINIQQPNRMPTSISIYPVVLFSILDHYLRRKDDQDRVIGTLLGTRMETRVAIQTSFVVAHSETSEQVAKVNLQEVIVGWWSHLAAYPALIQNSHSQEIALYQAVYISLDSGVELGQPADVQGYISPPVGIFPKPENCVFVPIPAELRSRDSERSGVDLLTLITLSSLPSTSPSTLSSPTTSLETLYSIENIISTIDRVLTYVRAVLAGEARGNAAIGRLRWRQIGTDRNETAGYRNSLGRGIQFGRVEGKVRLSSTSKLA